MMEELEPGVRRIVAPNPSPMTAQGTCSYVLGTGRVAVIDPGPADANHIRAILAGLAHGERIEAILVSHAHLDHSPGARMLSEATGVPVHAFGPPEAGRSEVMHALAAGGMAGGGEGVDAAFSPDVRLPDGAEIGGATWQVRALHTPGHFGNHLSFVWGKRVFTGDVVMGWSSTLISPPDGDLGDYFRTLERLRAEKAAIFYPGHGAPVGAPEERLQELAQHRRDRTAQILAALADGAATVSELTARIYADVPPALQGAARRNVFAHLVDLVFTGAAEPEGVLSPEVRFRPA